MTQLAQSIAITLRNQFDKLRRLADTERGHEADEIVRRCESWFSRWWAFRASSERLGTSPEQSNSEVSPRNNGPREAAEEHW